MPAAASYHHTEVVAGGDAPVDGGGESISVHRGVDVSVDSERVDFTVDGEAADVLY